MPRKYKRKERCFPRGEWAEGKLAEAIRRVKVGDIGINDAAKYFSIPSRTLRRKLSSMDIKKHGLGPPSILGNANEKRLVACVQRLSVPCFARDRKQLRQMAFHFAERLGLKH
ncbi:hypothetical protein PR048_004407 [Dryococelus australis]|uniref:HTH psq-type domain-containing protein n=1 Tax=Dryococelus australis TaxID=614101 RepID=A0ABQ9I5C8_9NEOP|nr:hypothetical protein PR048_004407 [Dryococelus australis]